MSKAGHTFTAGPVIVRGGYVLTEGVPFLKIAAIVTTNNDTETAQANANLIAEAFTVTHETGLTPRQLAEQRDELLASLREIETICTESAGDCRRRMGTRVGNTIATARAAIAKATAGGA